MLGVLMQRAPAFMELISDQDDDLVNWWLCVRDRPEELEGKLNCTPHSRTLYTRYLYALRKREIADPLERAVAYTVCITQGINKSTAGTGWLFKTLRGVQQTREHSSRISLLASRMASVQIDNRCALTVLKSTSECSHAVVYCDPPYLSVNNHSDYREGNNKLDVDGLAERLRDHKGSVAISGFPGEWDRLGWREARMTRKLQRVGVGAGDARTECLWMNYDPIPTGLWQVPSA